MKNWSNNPRMETITVLQAFITCFLIVLAEAQRPRPSYHGNRYGGPKPNRIESEFSSARSKVALTCDTGKIVLKMNFVDAFRGVAQIGPKASRECIIRGDGRRKSYILTVPLDGCGTCKGHNCNPGTFVNTLTIRYHPTLELDGDDVKTVICKYQAGSVQTSG